MIESEETDTLPPDNTLRKPGQSSCQLVSNIMGKVLDPSSKRHNNKAVLGRIINPRLKILRDEKETTKLIHFVTSGTQDLH